MGVRFPPGTNQRTALLEWFFDPHKDGGSTPLTRSSLGDIVEIPPGTYTKNHSQSDFLYALFDL